MGAAHGWIAGVKAYLDLMRDVLAHGEARADRTGTGTLSIFGRQTRYDLRAGFPCLTTKKLHLRSIIHELLWFLRGETNTRYLKENGVTIWDDWADEEGELGPIYGKQWRAWPTPEGRSIDQIRLLIDGLLGNPPSRRHVVSAWNVGQIHQMALPPCHLLFQFYVHEPLPGSRPGLSCQLYQRSADLFLGVPFNIASYALLTHLVAHVCNYEARDFVHTFGDVHLYHEPPRPGRTATFARAHRLADTLAQPAGQGHRCLHHRRHPLGELRAAAPHHGPGGRVSRAAR